jgi:hypothetical protein
MKLFLRARHRLTVNFLRLNLANWADWRFQWKPRIVNPKERKIAVPGPPISKVDWHVRGVLLLCDPTASSARAINRALSACWSTEIRTEISALATSNNSTGDSKNDRTCILPDFKNAKSIYRSTFWPLSS